MTPRSYPSIAVEAPAAMARLRYEPLPCLCNIIRMIVEALPEAFGHVRTGRVYCVASRGHRGASLARIHGMSPAWAAVGLGPAYLIEVVEENYAPLPPQERVRVVIHELLHIPRTFSGALRPHGRLVNERAVRRLERTLARRDPRAFRAILEEAASCPPPGGR